MSTMTNREFLRLHLEAGWGISVPPLARATVELSAAAALPPWALYQARLATSGRVAIWHPNVSPRQRADLLERARNAGEAFDPALGMRREVVLRLAATPDASGSRPQHAPRLLKPGDEALLEAFEAESASYFLDPRRAPCMGVIIAGRLVSVAHSSRRTREACELGINTLPDARRQGYAAAAVRAWTQAILQEGLTPIYSAFAHNTASLRLAARTGYAPVSESVYGPVTAEVP